MSATPLLPSDAAPDIPQKRFTRQELEQLLDSGFFDGQRFELIDGELFDKQGQKPGHAATVRRLDDLLRAIFGRCVQVRSPMEAGGADRDRSVPEPDVAVLRELKLDYDDRHPRGDELALAVEVSTPALPPIYAVAEIYANVS